MLSVTVHPFLWLGFIFVLGTMVGSFLNVVIYRTPLILLKLDNNEDDVETELQIPKKMGKRLFFSFRYLIAQISYDLAYLKDFGRESLSLLKGLSFPGSHCGYCQNSIAWYDNLPVISWFILRGRCRQCQKAYAFRYPLIEALTAFIFVSVFWRFGLSTETFWLLALSSVLWSIFWIDYDTQFIFNVMTYPSIFLGLLYNGSKGNLKWSLLGGSLAWFLFAVVMFLSIWLLQKEGMGGGDVKLAILIGVWLGPPLMLVALFLAFVMGSIAGIVLLATRRQSQPFPFGPFLVAGAFTSLFFGNSLWSWYINKSFV